MTKIKLIIHYLYCVIQLTIIEDDSYIRRNLLMYVDFQDDMHIVSDHDSVEKFLTHIDSGNDQPEVLILDIGLPGLSGLEGILPIKSRLPNLDIIMLTTYEEEDKIILALRSGACSYLSKKTPLDQIMETIRIVNNGGSYMSPSIARKLSEFMLFQKKSVKQKLSGQQEKVMKGLVDGMSYKEIAKNLEVSIDTVRTHIKRIYSILHVNSKSQAVSKYLKG